MGEMGTAIGDGLPLTVRASVAIAQVGERICGLAA